MKPRNASNSAYTPAFNEFLYEFLRIFLISENSLKFANFFAEVTNSRSMAGGVPAGSRRRRAAGSGERRCRVCGAGSRRSAPVRPWRRWVFRRDPAACRSARVCAGDTSAPPDDCVRASSPASACPRRRRRRRRTAPSAARPSGRRRSPERTTSTGSRAPPTSSGWRRTAARGLAAVMSTWLPGRVLDVRSAVWRFSRRPLRPPWPRPPAARPGWWAWRPAAGSAVWSAVDVLRPAQSVEAARQRTTSCWTSATRAAGVRGRPSRVAVSSNEQELRRTASSLVPSPSYVQRLKITSVIQVNSNWNRQQL